MGALKQAQIRADDSLESIQTHYWLTRNLMYAIQHITFASQELSLPNSFVSNEQIEKELDKAIKFLESARSLLTGR